MVAGNRTDGELIREFVAAGNEAAFEELVRRHGPLVLSVCRRVLDRRHDAEDIMQSVFMILAQKAESLLDRPSLAGWLHRVAWHVSLRHRRAALLRRNHERNAGQIWIRVKLNVNEPDDLAIELDRALNLLRDEFREPLILHHLQGHTIEEAAELMDCKVGTVASRLSRGREMLRERLERWGVVLTVAVTGELLLSGAGPGGAASASVAAAPAAIAGTGWEALAASASAAPPTIGAASAAASVGVVAVQSALAKKLMAVFVAGSFCTMTVAGVVNYPGESNHGVSTSQYQSEREPLPQPAADTSCSRDSYSYCVAPEPGSLSLLASASLLLLRRRQR
jgi:RNA polymerase sigma factor (sigma-70 family)